MPAHTLSTSKTPLHGYPDTPPTFRMTLYAILHDILTLGQDTKLLAMQHATYSFPACALSNVAARATSLSSASLTQVFLSNFKLLGHNSWSARASRRAMRPQCGPGSHERARWDAIEIFSVPVTHTTRLHRPTHSLQPPRKNPGSVQACPSFQQRVLYLTRARRSTFPRAAPIRFLEFPRTPHAYKHILFPSTLCRRTHMLSAMLCSKRVTPELQI